MAKIRSALNKGEGILTTILFVFFSAYKAGSSVFYVILLGESLILLIMYGVLYVAWLIYLMLMIIFAPVGAAYLWVPVGLTVIYVAFMIMILVLIIFTYSVIAKTR
jgi:hypothetical protein